MTKKTKKSVEKLIDVNHQKDIHLADSAYYQEESVNWLHKEYKQKEFEEIVEKHHEVTKESERELYKHIQSESDAPMANLHKDFFSLFYIGEKDALKEDKYRDEAIKKGLISINSFVDDMAGAKYRKDLAKMNPEIEQIRSHIWKMYYVCRNAYAVESSAAVNNLFAALNKHTAYTEKMNNERERFYTEYKRLVAKHPEVEGLLQKHFNLANDLEKAVESGDLNQIEILKEEVKNFESQNAALCGTIFKLSQNFVTSIVARKKNLDLHFSNETTRGVRQLFYVYDEAIKEQWIANHISNNEKNWKNYGYREAMINANNAMCVKYCGYIDNAETGRRVYGLLDVLNQDGWDLGYSVNDIEIMRYTFLAMTALTNKIIREMPNELYDIYEVTELTCRDTNMQHKLDALIAETKHNTRRIHNNILAAQHREKDSNSVVTSMYLHLVEVSKAILSLSNESDAFKEVAEKIERSAINMITEYTVNYPSIERFQCKTNEDVEGMHQTIAQRIEFINGRATEIQKNEGKSAGESYSQATEELLLYHKEKAKEILHSKDMLRLKSEDDLPKTLQIKADDNLKLLSEFNEESAEQTTIYEECDYGRKQ